MFMSYDSWFESGTKRHEDACQSNLEGFTTKAQRSQRRFRTHGETFPRFHSPWPRCLRDGYSRAKQSKTWESWGIWGPAHREPIMQNKANPRLLVVQTNPIGTGQSRQTKPISGGAGWGKAGEAWVRLRETKPNLGRPLEPLGDGTWGAYCAKRTPFFDCGLRPPLGAGGDKIWDCGLGTDLRRDARRRIVQNKPNLRRVGPLGPVNRAKQTQLGPADRAKQSQLPAVPRGANRRGVGAIVQNKAKFGQIGTFGGLAHREPIMQNEANCRRWLVVQTNPIGARQSRQTNPIAASARWGKAGEALVRLCETKPNVGKVGYLGEGTRGSLLCKTNPTWPGWPVLRRAECAKRTQFAKAQKVHHRGTEPTEVVLDSLRDMTSILFLRALCVSVVSNYAKRTQFRSSFKLKRQVSSRASGAAVVMPELRGSLEGRECRRSVFYALTSMDGTLVCTAEGVLMDNQRK
jgi:hypothetical protein